MGQTQARKSGSGIACRIYACEWLTRVSWAGQGRRLRCCNGNEALYLRLLQLFCDTGKGLATELAEAMQRQDWPQLRLLSHSIKGSAANIGAIELAECAGAWSWH